MSQTGIKITLSSITKIIIGMNRGIRGTARNKWNERGNSDRNGEFACNCFIASLESASKADFTVFFIIFFSYGK